MILFVSGGGGGRRPSRGEDLAIESAGVTYKDLCCGDVGRCDIGAGDDTGFDGDEC